MRPQIFFGQHWGIAAEAAFEAKRFARTGSADGSATCGEANERFGLMPYFSPSGRGSYKRPQLRLIYALTTRNDGARELYPAQDVFSQRGVEQFIGLGAEWWFNSSSYP